MHCEYVIWWMDLFSLHNSCKYLLCSVDFIVFIHVHKTWKIFENTWERDQWCLLQDARGGEKTSVINSSIKMNDSIVSVCTFLPWCCVIFWIFIYRRLSWISVIFLVLNEVRSPIVFHVFLQSWVFEYVHRFWKVSTCRATGHLN
jgi:hypothetical protein